MSRINKFIFSGLLLLGLPVAMVCAAEAPKPPDLTAGGEPDNQQRWTLGATGARGWVWSRTLAGGSENTAARQILVTEVAKGSPADGVLQVGDVITGLDGRPFDGDARRLFAQALAGAEQDPGGGVLKLARWRGGVTENVRLTLQVMGAYAPTAPYGCAKSKRIFEQGCAAIAKRGFKGGDGTVHVSIDNDLNALALLALVASGRDDYRPLVADYAQKIAGCRPGPGFPESWEYGYNTLFLAEYALATRDPSVMDGLRDAALAIARGQGGTGTWGHRFARSDGILHGYGAMNQPGITLTLAMALAREAGVKDPALDAAIAKSANFLRWFVNKGAIPYGDHEPYPWHDDNGKCSQAAVLFDLLGDREAAAFFSRMGAAAYAERESGHTGNFFNILWALPGVSRCGPSATAAYFRETSWYYDMARGWDGRVEYVGFRGGNSHNGWDCTGAYLLGYALPLKSLYLTGRKKSAVPALTPAAVNETIAAGRDFTFQGAESKEWYASRTTEALLAGLTSWSPAVRTRSAQALKHRDGGFLPQLLQRLGSADRNSRYGACEALANLGSKADAAAPQVRALLRDKDPWLRMLAARALPCMGAEVRSAAVPDLLRAATIKDSMDPRQRLVGEVAKALFTPAPGTRRSSPVPILEKSLDGVDRTLLHAALKEVLANEDGLIRGLAAPLYPLLSAEDVRVLLPEIVTATRKNAPSGEMFRHGIRWAGLELLARFRIREGMGICVDMMNEFEWGSEQGPCLAALRKYGGAAREVIPRLHETRVAMRKGYADNHWNDRLKPDLQAIEKLITEIEADPNSPTVFGMNEFTCTNVNAGNLLESADPDAVDLSVWNNVKPGLHSGFGSVDVAYFKSMPPAGAVTETLKLQGWKGERVNGMLLVWSPGREADIRITTEGFSNENSRLAKENVSISAVGYVLSDAFDGPVDRPDKGKFPVHLKPDRLSGTNGFTLDGPGTRPVWISLDIPREAPAGLYQGTISRQSSSGTVRHPVVLEVQDATLPPPSEWSFHLDLWQHPDAVARWGKVAAWSPEHLALLRPMLTMLARAGQKCITTTIVEEPWKHQTFDAFGSMVKWTKKSNGSWMYDYSRFDSYVSLAMECGINRQINCYSMVPVGNKVTWYDETSAKMVAAELLPGTVEYEAVWGGFLKNFTAHLRQKGWLDKTTIALDERDHDEMRKLFAFLKTASPELKISMAGSYFKELNPLINDFSSNFNHIDALAGGVLESRKQAGLKTTYYVACCIPEPNTFTFSPPAEACYIGWLASALRFDGFLRWAYNSWAENPETDSRFIRWPAGDAYLVYPNAQSSIRFERLREGIQDYEKIRILRQALAGNASAEAAAARARLDAFMNTINTKTLRAGKPAADVINQGKRLLGEIVGAKLSKCQPASPRQGKPGTP
jgi:hypothetical protein